MSNITRVAVVSIAAFVLSFAPEVSTAQSRDFHDRSVTVYNHTNTTVWEFYASNVGTDDWEEDVLGGKIIASGNSNRFNIDDGTGYCVYDVKVVFKNGAERIKRRVNVCAAAELHVYAEGIAVR